MKKLFILLSILSVLSFLTATSLLSSQEVYDCVVVGSSDPAHDAKAIQDAVDQGGTLLLKGTFNFGDKGRVNISRDVKIFGEADKQGKPLTKIMGGHWTFFSPLPSKTEAPQAPGPKITIQNIHFDGAVWTPMHFPYTSGALISANKITNVMPFEVPVKWKGGETLWIHAGALFGTRFINKEKILPGTTGNLVFENNEVDLRCENPKITMGQAAFFFWTWGANIEIKGNTLKNVSRNSIESLDNYRDEEGRGMVVITDNTIITPAEGCPFPGPTNYPNGIVVGWFADMSGGADPVRNSKVIIMNNSIETSGDLASGIISLGDGPVILDNKIVMRGGSKSKGITQLGCNGFIAKNKIEGSGAWAMRTLPYKALKGSCNTFTWNDVKQFKASSTDFLCLGNNNILVGTKCKVVDKGKGNRIFVEY
jgi:hypothetical protein